LALLSGELSAKVTEGLNLSGPAGHLSYQERLTCGLRFYH